MKMFRLVLAIIAFIFIITSVYIHLAKFIPFTIDDAYITFAHTKNYVEGEGLVFSKDSKIEATSSFLWALFLIPFEHALPYGAVIGSKVLGIIFVFFILIFTNLIFYKRNRNIFLSIAASFLIILSSPFMSWAVTGMENSLVALFLILSVFVFYLETNRKKGYFSAVLVFLLYLSRPEAFMFAIIFAFFRIFYFFVYQDKLKRWLLTWLAVLILLIGAYEIFGFLYYGYLLPCSAMAKLGIHKSYFVGLNYLTNYSSFIFTITFLISLISFTLLIILKLKKDLKKLRLLLIENSLNFILIALISAQFLFIIKVGGDWMPNGRFISHIIPLIIILLFEVFIYLFWQIKKRKYNTLIVNTMTAIVCTAYVFFFVHGNISIYKFAHPQFKHLQQAEESSLTEMVNLLNNLTKLKYDTVACSDVGRMSYSYKGKVLDWWGLANIEIATQNMSYGRLNPNIILSKKPKFIILYSNLPVLDTSAMKKGMARYSKAFAFNKEFNENYQQLFSTKFDDERYHVLFRRVDREEKD
ncbi:MAG: hypothetical protein ABIA04_00275 [Pseudomonadota bacterium]